MCFWISLLLWRVAVRCLYLSTGSRLIGQSVFICIFVNLSICVFLYFCISVFVVGRSVCINQQVHGWLVQVVYLRFDKPTSQRAIAWKSHGPNCTSHKYKYKYDYVFSAKLWNHPIRRMEFTICKLYSSAADSEIEMHLFLNFSPQTPPHLHSFKLR